MLKIFINGETNIYDDHHTSFFSVGNTFLEVSMVNPSFYTKILKNNYILNL